MTHRCACSHIKALHRRGVCLVERCGCVECRYGMNIAQGQEQPREVTFCTQTGVIIEWELLIGNLPRHGEPFPPTLLFMVDDIHLALRQGTITLPRGGTLDVDRAGFATCTAPGAGSAVYELFPTRFDDDEPYRPCGYVGRWPD